MLRLFYSQTKMSLHEGLLTCLVCAVVGAVFWKWAKTLLIMINLEAASAIVLFIILLNCGLSGGFFLIIVFLVSEALILLASLYSAMRLVGASYSFVSIW